jgi:hypothetical protein
MTDRKAMEMALEALTAHYQSKDEADVHRARVIQALEAALAQEQIKCPRCGEVNPAEIHTCSPQVAQPEQEPVCDKDPYYCGYVRCQLGKVCKNTAPPKREWVGLTDEEVSSIENAGVWGEKDIRAIEAKLKEKNT